MLPDVIFHVRARRGEVIRQGFPELSELSRVFRRMARNAFIYGIDPDVKAVDQPLQPRSIIR